MSDFVTFDQSAGLNSSQQPVTVTKGVNPMLVTHFEVTPQGGALLHMMGGATVAIDKAQWDVVGKRLCPAAEPSAKAPPAL